MLQIINKILRSVFVSTLMFTFFLGGFPSTALLDFVSEHFADRKVVDLMYLASKDSNVIDKGFIELLKPSVDTAHAANFQMQTGYYVGNGGVQSITGVGFKPEMIVLKGNSNGGTGAYFKTSAMPTLNSASFLATVDASAGDIRIDSDGFTVSGAVSNVANERHSWVAFTGSDCTASGTFCVGSYVGSGTGTRMISTGFQPSMVIVKRSTAVAASWRSSTMSSNQAGYFLASTTDSTGSNFTTLDSTGFTVGSVNNISSGIYYYVAFKESAGVMDVGTYTGNGSDNRNITGVGFVPDFMFTKSSTAVSATYNVTESYGDNSTYFTDTANLVNSIQALQSDGFQVGTDATANGNTNTYHYAAFGGASDTRNSSGTFSMASGSYTGTGTVNIFSGLNFAPDLVIIKREGTTAGVFRTRMMGGDSTAYLDSATANLTNAIMSLNPDGFTIGTSTEVNLATNIYHWQAFGNAWRPDKNSGSADFFIGAYYGNGIDATDITRLPFQPDFVAIKRSGATGGTWRSSVHTGDTSSFFAATAETTNNIQAFNTDGFEVGTAANVNTAANHYFYFGFKEGSKFDVGGYTGNGTDNRDITDPGFQPDLVWVKQSTAVAGVTRPSTLAGDLTQYFINTAQAAGRIKSFVSTGFRLGTQSEVNTNAGVYRYMAWATTTVQGSAPTYNIQTGYYVGNGGAQSITGVGFKPEMILLKANTADGTGAYFKTSAMQVLNSSSLINTADITSGLYLDADGFTVSGANTNTNLVRHTWTAFTGSNCTAGGSFCVGSYFGSGTGTRMISTGFQPDLVIVKRSINTAGLWRSSTMLTNHAAFFSASTTDTTGLNIVSLNSTGFTVGAANNAIAGTYYFVAFKESAGVMDVGTYTGNGSDNRNITGVGFVPDFMFTKSTTTNSSVYSLTESYGDNSSYFTDTANLVNGIQALQSDGFQVGTDATVNTNAGIYHYAAFGGASDNRNSSGTFSMASGSYTGTGMYNTIKGLNFAPDLVIIKREGTTAGVFRTRMMGGDSTAYLDAATANFAGGITSLEPDGFTVNTDASVNTAANIYHWQAFGNAWRPEKNAGASDFFIGAYYGNGIDNMDITRMPFQPDFLAVKRSGATAGMWRSSTHSGDIASFYAATADAANNIQAFNTDGFEIGSSAGTLNTAASLYWYFGFKEGSNFDVGGYTGNGSDNRDITDPGFQPDLAWIKQSTAVAGVTRPSTLAGDLTQYFINTAQAAGRIKSFISGGFRLGTQAEVNTNAGVYRYVAWNTKQYSQGSYRLFENANSTDVGTALAAVNTAGTLAATGDNFRLRMLIGITGGVLFSSSQNFKLQFAEKSGTCDTAFTGETYADITGATVIAYDTTNTPADGDNLTANVNDPTASGSVNNQDYEEANNFTNTVSTIASGEFGKWDFSLIDNGATAETSYCIRAVKSDGSLLNSYIQIPEIITAAGGGAPQSLTFSISDNTVRFGTLSPIAARYATGDTNGSGSDSTDAHTMSASTNANGGYVITVNGTTLTCSSCGGATITAIGGSATASSVGSEQFGLRVTVNSGTGSATSPYNTANWAFDTGNLPDQIASGSSDEVTTVFGLRYIGNIDASTDAGSYNSMLNYTITGTF